jgi:hypothetical protein
VKECDPSNQYHAFIYKNNYLWKLDGQTNYPSREGKYTDCMDQLRRVLSRAHEEKSDVEIVVFAKHPAILMEDHLRDCIEELNKLDADIKNEIKGNLDPSEASQINSLSLTKAGRAIYADRNALEFVIRNIEEAIRRKRMEIEIKMNLFYEKRRAKLGWLPVSPSDHSTDQYESTPTSDFSSDRSDGSNHMENQDENVPAETSPKDEESTDQQERIPLLFSGYDLGDQLDLLEEQDEAVKAATSLKDQDSTILQQSTTPSVSSSDLTNVPELVEDHDEAVKEVTFLKKKTSTDQQLSPPPLSSDDNEVDGTGFIGEHSMTVVTALLELAKESTTFIGCEKEEKVTKPAGTDKDIRETGGEVKSDTENTPSTFQNRPKKRKRDSDDDDNSEEDMASCPSKKK